MGESRLGESRENYEICDELGSGGFARVYSAQCRLTGCMVALKMIDKARMTARGMQTRVNQEVSIHSRLKHPSILELYTFFEDAHYVYLVLELAHNRELARYFKHERRGLGELAAAKILRQVVDGVLYLHSHRIIHRDLSLNNLLLTKDMKVKIADFGLATQLNEPDEKHLTMCGTPNYISPEVASRSQHGLPADLWGLGCLLYTLLVGRPPFDTHHVKHTLDRVIHADYEMPVGLSIEAQDLLDRLLRKNPAERISLNQLIHHPFLKKAEVTSIVSNDDSGFHTTMHTTRSSHHNRTRSREGVSTSEMLVRQRQGSFDKRSTKPVSFDMLMDISKDNVQYGQDFLRRSMTDARVDCIDLNQRFDCKLKSYEEIKRTEDNHSILNKKLSFVESNAPTKNDDNKENSIPTVGGTRSLGVPPLCTVRLGSVTHRTRYTEMSIDDDGSVTLRFIKRGRHREESIREVCRVSKDGMHVVVHLVNGGKGCPVGTPLPTHAPHGNEVFTYHNLPQKHWKKYLYAAQFVESIKAKTPKVTLYTPQAKCYMMENGTDFEAVFHGGEKITMRSNDRLKIVDKDGNLYNNSNNLNGDLKEKHDHFQKCMKRCLEAESALNGLSDDCFPLVMGRLQHHISNEATSPQITPPMLQRGGSFNIGSFCHSTGGSGSSQLSEINRELFFNASSHRMKAFTPNGEAFKSNGFKN